VAPDATRHPFTRKLQLDCAQESAAGQEPTSHITDERSYPPQCIDFELVFARNPRWPSQTVARRVYEQAVKRWRDRRDERR
jgi:hypothetical protein